MARVNLWRPEPKRRAGIVRPPVVPGLSLSRYSNKELAVRIVRRSNLPKQDPGIAWARLMRESNRPEKDTAREAVLQLFTIEQFPRLSILTFPASAWRFELALLEMREGVDFTRHGPRRTIITAVERDEAIFRAAVHSIPRGRAESRLGRVRVLEAPRYATACVNSAHISRFSRCTFEDYATYDGGVERERSLDAAWLDFNGHLSPSRLAAIESFWNRRLRSLLVVTLLNARTCDWISARAKYHGGVEHLLAASLPESSVESVMQYGDTSPMIQVVLRRQTAQV